MIIMGRQPVRFIAAHHRRIHKADNGIARRGAQPVLWTSIQVASYRGKFDVYSVDPLALADKIGCPVYLVHGTGDQLISTAHSENIRSAGRREEPLVRGRRPPCALDSSRETGIQRTPVKVFHGAAQRAMRGRQRATGKALRAKARRPSPVSRRPLWLTLNQPL